MRKLAIGDIHGAKKALDQVLERANFDPSSDRLIFLGDVADGFPEVPEVFEFILGLDNYGYVMGNHDYWLYEYLKFQKQEWLWLHQGGQATLDAYKRVNDPAMNERHLKFLESTPYYIEEDGNLFVHGGFLTAFPIKNQAPYDLIWDRDLWWNAK
ncbi:metallophosphoesterase, partial [bacterium]|nr:metallophosphoesterase [bacterium]